MKVDLSRTESLYATQKVDASPRVSKQYLSCHDAYIKLAAVHLLQSLLTTALGVQGGAELWALGPKVWCSLLAFESPFSLLTWQKMTLPPHLQVDLLQFES